MRYVRPSLYLSGAMIIWGVMATLQAVAGGPSGRYAIRFFLGVFESACIAGAPYLVSLMYPRASVGKRLCVYLASTPFAGAFGGWIAYGVAHIESHIKTWQILFLIEGLLTIVFGLLCLWVLPDRGEYLARRFFIAPIPVAKQRFNMLANNVDLSPQPTTRNGSALENEM